jgi:uncharacterized protein YfaP (DUF2135 family)
VLLGGATVVALVLGLACVAAYYVGSVYRYAELRTTPQIQRVPFHPDRLWLAYSPASSGKVGFRRADVDRETELLDRVVPAAVGKEQTFEWRLSDLQAGDVIRVTYRQGLLLRQESLAVPEPPQTEATLTGQVVNAISNRPIPEAEVRITGTGLSASTDPEGWFRLTGLPPGVVPIEVSAPGFTAERCDWELAAGRESGVRVVLSPGLEEGQVRVVLTWGEDPEDLDAHLKGPLPDGDEFHVYFHDKGDLKSRQFVRLDVDDRNGEGPETITVLGVLPGTYRYFVHDYSNRDDAQSSRLARSGAEVKVYHGGQKHAFRAGHDRVGNLWNVCTIEVLPDGTALVTKTDTYEATRSQALGLYDKRTRGDRGQWIGQYGGSTTSEEAVAEGLRWLARHQDDDGSWSSRCLGNQRPPSKCEADAPCSGAGGTYEMAHTGLAILAFQAGGHYYFNNNTYSEVVRAALDWMVDHQRPDGALVGSANPPAGKPFHKHFMYEHGIAAFALTEACALAAAMGEPPSERYTSAARRAVQFIEAMQHADGGWRYTDERNLESDTSVTGWQVLALKTAKEAGIPVSDPCVQQIRSFFDNRAMGANGRTEYLRLVPGTDAMTGVGMLARQFLLGEPDAPLVHDAASYLADQAEKSWADRQAKGSNKDFYLWYNCTLAMFQAGGEPWEQWNPIVRDTIINLQRHDGCARGSWDPSSKWGRTGGRIYTTALAVLTLEVYYRYASHEEATEAFQAIAPRVQPLEARSRPESIEPNARGKAAVELHERAGPKSSPAESVEPNAREAEDARPKTKAK